MYDVIVVGAGASGLFAAGIAAGLGKRTLLVEKMPRTGRKILITGKGRCNVTNNCDAVVVMKNTVSNPKFLFSALTSWSPADTMSFFESRGVPLKTERGGRVFPESDRAMDIADALLSFCKSNGVKVVTDTVVKIIAEDGKARGVCTASGKTYEAASVIVATGGISFPKTGSTGDGYRFAKETGHEVTEPRAALVGLETDDGDCALMQGLSLKNTALALINIKRNKTVFKDMGEMLFTHFGVSGPMVLSASSFVKGNPCDYEIVIDLKPALSFETLMQRISRDFALFINREISNALGELLPKSIIPVVISRSGIDEHKKVNQITKEEKSALCSQIKLMRFKIKNRGDAETAIITAGGVSVRQIDPKTMQSKIVKGLYFTGEMIDVDARTGGFNLQIAFSTGYTAGKNA